MSIDILIKRLLHVINILHGRDRILVAISNHPKKLNSHHFQSHRTPTSFFTLLLGENIYGSTIRQHGDMEKL